MKRVNLLKLLLITTVLLGALLRLISLDSFPSGVTADEIQQGYSGYSILKTARDEWGDFLPLNPRGFGDYKPPLYSYLTIPFEAVLGLNMTSVRLPAALAGAFTILVMYLLVVKLFQSKSMGVLAAFFLAISSWHIYMSRFAWESNVGLLLFILGILFFVKSFEKNKLLPLSVAFFGLSLFSYHSFKLLSILYVLGLVVFYGKKLIHFDKKSLVLTFGVGFVCLSLIIFGFFFGGGSRRATDLAFYQESNLSQLRQIQIKDGLPPPFNRLINNRIDFLITQFTQNYLIYFSTSFLTSPSRSESTLFNMPGSWLIPFWELVFAILGLYWIIRNHFKWSKIILLWILLTPIPAALTKEFMYAQRVQGLLAVFPLLAAFGVYSSFAFLKKFQWRWLLVGVLSLAIFWSSVKWWDFYLEHQFNKSLGGVKYGYQEVVNYTEANKDKYNQIIFTKINSEPHIFVAFYSQMDPSEFQQSAQNWKYFEEAGFKFVDMINYSLGKYQFRGIDWDKDKQLKDTLIVATPGEVPTEVKTKLVVKDIIGKPMFLLIDTNENL